MRKDKSNSPAFFRYKKIVERKEKEIDLLREKLAKAEFKQQQDSATISNLQKKLQGEREHNVRLTKEKIKAQTRLENTLSYRMKYYFIKLKLWFINRKIS